MQKQCVYMTTDQSGKRQIDHNSIEVTLTFSDIQKKQHETWKWNITQHTHWKRYTQYYTNN